MKLRDDRAGTREAVPFRLRTADGELVELSYSSPRPVAQRLPLLERRELREHRPLVLLRRLRARLD